VADTRPQQYLRRARRCPTLPPRDEIPEDQLDAYDMLVARIEEWKANPNTIIDGEAYGVPHFTALAVSPKIGKALSELGRAIQSEQDEPDQYTRLDHEMIDQLLAIDSGYYALVGGHTHAAIAAGVRIEALEAVADGRDDDLTDEERQRVDFIRAVRDGTMTDELWEQTIERLGSERAAIHFASHVLLLVFHHRICWAVGAPEMERDAWRDLLQEYKDGRRPVPEHYGNRYAARK
jgi:hypothetical protein